MKKLFRVLIITFAVLSAIALLASCAAPAAAKTLPQAVSTEPAATANTALPAPPPAPTPAPLGPYDVSVSIQYRITLDDSVKNTDPNIIRAARQGMFDYDAGNAHHAHYQGYAVEYDILIFEVDQKDSNTWEVRFREKQPGDAAYPDGYSFVTVTKQASGVYVGDIINPGGPMSRGDETY